MKPIANSIIALTLLCLLTSHPAIAAPPQTLPITQLIQKIPVDKGICVILGPNAAPLAIDLANKTNLTLFIQTDSPTDARAARQAAEQAGLLGSRIYIHQAPLSRIALAENIADTLIVLTEKYSPSEATRILHPGARIIHGQKTSFTPTNPAFGEWSHPYHGPDNNPNSEDTVAKGPYLTRFLAQPWYGPMPQVSVTSGGRMFKAFGHIAFKTREQALLNKLICISSYNGTILWERDLTDGFMVHRSTLIATPDVLYLGDDSSCKIIDAATGKILEEITLPKNLANGPAWKWMAIKDGTLYALVGETEKKNQTLYGERPQAGWPWTGLGDMYDPKTPYEWGFGKTVVAIDLATRDIKWSHQSDKPLDSRSFTMNSNSLFVYSDQDHLAALDNKSGSIRWQTSDPEILAAIGQHGDAQRPTNGYSTSSYAKSSDQVLLFAGPQREKIVAVDPNNGSLKWTYGASGNFQLVIRKEGLYAMGRLNESRLFDPESGEVLSELQSLRGNCTRATGAADAVFARGDLHGGTLRLQTDTNSPTRIAAMRPACQDGVVIANGQLFWGPWMCDCNHSLVGVVSLGPSGNFKFNQSATDKDRLTTSTTIDAGHFPKTDTNDWPTYRGSNTRTASSPVNVATNAKLTWRTQPAGTFTPTAPVAAGGYIFTAGTDGVVRAHNASTGKLQWKAYTGGSIRYAPSINNGRVYVGSYDGYAYCFAASTGKQLWRFRAAPTERAMPVYGTLASTWPVATGVLVQDNIAYFAAGIASHDGTHVYAVNATTGQIIWQNNNSGSLLGEGTIAGVAVQGHLLLHKGKLHMAGGNVVSPATYDAKTGACLNTLTNEWQKGPRGSELFLVGDDISVADRMLYSPRAYIPSRYYAKFLLQAQTANTVMQGTEQAIVCYDNPIPYPGKIDPNPVRYTPQNPPPKAKARWQSSHFKRTDAVVMANNAVIVAGAIADKTDDTKVTPALIAFNPKNGDTLWASQLPSAVAPWGLCIDRKGRVIATLDNGQTLCLAGE